jgi:4-hydroxy-3-polyprenylbenzoate decarboxylase
LERRHLIVAITGATGTIFGVRILQLLQGTDVDTHVVISRWGARTLAEETEYKVEQVQAMATHAYPAGDQGAAISSGSFVTLGMVIAPCTMNTLASIAHGHGDNLVHRAADVTLKERRKLVLLARETPLNGVHLENMLKLSRMGVVILPPMPAFYNHPQSLDEMVNHVAMRALDQFGLHLDVMRRWEGMNAHAKPVRS